MSEEMYTQLARKFDYTHTDNRGGIDLEYVTGEQVISRLNETLGVYGWEFIIREHGYNQDADEFWVLGQMLIWVPGQERAIRHEQFGSQKVTRGRKDEHILDVGFNLKGAATDALKKCATLCGVGLYLTTRKPGTRRTASHDASQRQPANGANGQQPAGAGGQKSSPTKNQAVKPIAGQQNGEAKTLPPLPEGRAYICTFAGCRKQLGPVKFANGHEMKAHEWATMSRDKLGNVYCVGHYKQVKKQHEEANQPDRKPATNPEPASVDPQPSWEEVTPLVTDSVTPRSMNWGEDLDQIPF